MASDLFDVDLRVGTILEAEEFAEARKPKMCKLTIDLGDEEVRSAAQLLYHHEPEELEGEQVVVATNLGTVEIAGFTSEVLTLGAAGEHEGWVALKPQAEVPDGSVIG